MRLSFGGSCWPPFNQIITYLAQTLSDEADCHEVAAGETAPPSIRKTVRPALIRGNNQKNSRLKDVSQNNGSGPFKKARVTTTRGRGPLRRGDEGDVSTRVTTSPSQELEPGEAMPSCGWGQGTGRRCIRERATAGPGFRAVAPCAGGRARSCSEGGACCSSQMLE